MNIQQRLTRIKPKLWRFFALALLTTPLLLIASLVVVPAASPAIGAQLADLLRALVGPRPVTELESLSNHLRDEVNRYRFGGNRPQPQISWSASGQTLNRNPSASSVPTVLPGKVAAGPLVPATNVVTAAPHIGWQAYGPAPHGIPLLARAIVMVDPQRSYAGVALVRIDLSQLKLHIMPGFVEPAHPSGIGRIIPNLGTVSPSDLSNLVAAFNGGFKSVHGHYGMMVNGLTLLKPINDMATVALYWNGDVQIGAWNRDILPSPDLIAYRQNCPPLIEAGQLNPALNTDASKAWGFTNNTDITWRTGLGITQDRRYLIYAVGNGTNVAFLAEALQKAGTYMAMQLDINQYYAQFVTYAHVNNQLAGERLLTQMTVNPKLFLTPTIRDFFYLTLR
jgi:phosphodiester glycosidase